MYARQHMILQHEADTLIPTYSAFTIHSHELNHLQMAIYIAMLHCPRVAQELQKTPGVLLVAHVLKGVLARLPAMKQVSNPRESGRDKHNWYLLWDVMSSTKTDYPDYPGIFSHHSSCSIVRVAVFELNKSNMEFEIKHGVWSRRTEPTICKQESSPVHVPSQPDLLQMDFCHQLQRPESSVAC